MLAGIDMLAATSIRWQAVAGSHLPLLRPPIMRSSLTPPGPSEFAAFYAPYISAVNGADLQTLLATQAATLRRACAGLTDEEALHRYADNKWSVKEVVGHIADAERIFAYRALRIGRGDPTPLSQFDENAYVAVARFDRRPLADLIDDFDAVRRQTLSLLRGLDPEAWERTGTASGKTVSTRAIFYIIAGHVKHHLRILASRYGVPVEGEEDAAP